MCSIFGRVATGRALGGRLPKALVAEAQERGRDSWGVSALYGQELRSTSSNLSRYPSDGLAYSRWVIGNARAEPTTEWVAEKTESDVQPFRAGALTVAHNGTFANDRELCLSAGLDPDDASLGSKIDTSRWTRVAALSVETPEGVLGLLERTVGSYGIAVGHASGWLVLATNYKPIWTRLVHGELEWTSVSPRAHLYLDNLADGWTMLEPYSALIVSASGVLRHQSLRPSSLDPACPPQRALAVCSGGLDSTVAAVAMSRQMPTDLLHITYGCRAEKREVEAVTAIAERLGIGLRTLDFTAVFAAIGSSRLTGTWQGAAVGEQGAEYAIEWVPARNTILLATALGIAEGHGYSHLVLGNNIEEAGAYPDNEQEFIGRLNDLSPFAVADSKQVTFEQPVGGLTKREIVSLGLALGAPLDLTWSCYDAGELHCGVCGPCYMRKTAFAMLDAPDPIDYLDDAPVGVVGV